MSIETYLTFLVVILGGILIATFGAMAWKTHQVSKEFEKDKS